MSKSLKINLVCNWYTQISSWINLLKQSIKARGIQRLVAPHTPNPLTKEIEIVILMIDKWQKNCITFQCIKTFWQMRKFLYFIFILLSTSSHKAPHTNLWPHAANFYLSWSVMSTIRKDWYRGSLKMHIMWLFVHCYT